MVLLLVSGILKMVVGFEHLQLDSDRWLPIHIFSSFMVAMALYMAFAKRGFSRYCH